MDRYDRATAGDRVCTSPGTCGATFPRRRYRLASRFSVRRTDDARNASWRGSSRTGRCDRGAAFCRTAHFRPAPTGARTSRVATSLFSVCLSTPVRAFAPGHVSGRRRSAQLRACCAPTTRLWTCPHSRPARWPTPVTSPSAPSTSRRRWRRWKLGSTDVLETSGRVVVLGGDHTIALPILRVLHRPPRTDRRRPFRRPSRHLGHLLRSAVHPRHSLPQGFRRGAAGEGPLHPPRYSGPSL